MISKEERGQGEQNHQAKNVVTPGTKITKIELSGQDAELSREGGRRGSRLSLLMVLLLNKSRNGRESDSKGRKGSKY